MKIVINKCWGGFGLSEKAKNRLLELGGDEHDRSNPALVQVVEELGKEADGAYAELYIVNITDGIKWAIDNYDGMESVHECHQVWR